MKSFFVCLMILSLLPSIASANLIGTYGQTYEVTEPSILEYFISRAKYMEKSGKLAKMKSQFIDTVKESIKRPQPVAGLDTTSTPKLWNYNPEFVLNRNIYDGKGNILFKAGTRINAFDHLHGGYNQELLFLNADDPRQLTWANKQLDKAKGQVKVILVSGSIEEAYRALNTRIFFDQNGILSKRFGLKYIPVSITPDTKNKVLKVQEYDMHDYKAYKQPKESS